MDPAETCSPTAATSDAASSPSASRDVAYRSTPTEEARAAVYTMAGYDDGQYYSPDVFGQGTGEAVRLEEYDWRQ